MRRMEKSSAMGEARHSFYGRDLGVQGVDVEVVYSEFYLRLEFEEVIGGQVMQLLRERINK